MSCFVILCKNKRATRGLKFFRLTTSRRQSWLSALGRDPNENVSLYNQVCADHFCMEDFDKFGKLKKTAVPSLKLKPTIASLITNKKRLEIVEKPKLEHRIQEHSYSKITTTTTEFANTNRSDEKVESTSISSAIRTVNHKRNTAEAQSSTKKSIRKKGSQKKRPRTLKLDNPFFNSGSQKMKLRCSTSCSHAAILKSKLTEKKRKIRSLKSEIKTLNGMVSMMKRWLLSSNHVMASEAILNTLLEKHKKINI